ncbi:hypothetical protein Sinac_6864 [Singulisphaera acidiphila DSM 18658]|uniref:Uncharacterized protein n=1 Tax=Singulisphaera acidiphila (strain ATCC BAA-1392 / DSM 18658 / VKM B-2454 / MOB10) TaxID=886293 RepID=L0DNI5_SINAD|nr:hypothetical protein Sinac_6864 [Singulisphaera acidiphila DSM 18658]
MNQTVTKRMRRNDRVRKILFWKSKNCRQLNESMNRKTDGFDACHHCKTVYERFFVLLLPIDPAMESRRKEHSYPLLFLLSVDQIAPL